MLIEHSDKLVTVEEARNRLWAADTLVDFDDGANATSKRLRDALGESQETLVHIETLSQRGYRFVDPVGRLPGPEEAAVVDGQQRRKPIVPDSWGGRARERKPPMLRRPR